MLSWVNAHDKFYILCIAPHFVLYSVQAVAPSGSPHDTTSICLVEFTIMFIVCVCKHVVVCGDVHFVHRFIYIADIAHMEEFMFEVMHQNTQCWFNELDPDGQLVPSSFIPDANGSIESWILAWVLIDVWGMYEQVLVFNRLIDLWNNACLMWVFIMCIIALENLTNTITIAKFLRSQGYECR